MAGHTVVPVFSNGGAAQPAGVKGNDKFQDDLSIVWTFVVEGNPPMIGISVPTHSAISGNRYVALDLIKTHEEFTLNVPDESWVTEFDQIDMTASKFSDKFAD